MKKIIKAPCVACKSEARPTIKNTAESLLANSHVCNIQHHTVYRSDVDTILIDADAYSR
jgi:hypothetical protein